MTGKPLCHTNDKVIFGHPATFQLVIVEYLCYQSDTLLGPVQSHYHMVSIKLSLTVVEL